MSPLSSRKVAAKPRASLSLGSSLSIWELTSAASLRLPWRISTSMTRFWYAAFLAGSLAMPSLYSRVAIARAQIEIAHLQVCLLEVLRMTLDLVEDAHHLVVALRSEVMHGQEFEKAVLFGIVIERRFQHLLGVPRLVLVHEQAVQLGVG